MPEFNTITAQVEFIRLGTRNVELYDTMISRDIYNKILLGKSYPVIAYNANSIVDIGAYLGFTSLWFHALYPNATIQAFEPSPKSYHLLRKNVAGIPNIKTFNFGLGLRKHNARLHQGTIDPAMDSTQHQKYTTPSNKYIQIQPAKKHTPEIIDILKIDTEGNELDILRSLKYKIPQIPIIYLETHSNHDRLTVDQWLKNTHLLTNGRIYKPDRAELAYVGKKWLNARPKNRHSNSLDPGY